MSRKPCARIAVDKTALGAVLGAGDGAQSAVTLTKHPCPYKMQSDIPCVPPQGGAFSAVKVDKKTR